MKIVIINATYGIGSTGGLVKDIQDMLISRGDECIVYCGETNAEKEYVRVVGSKIEHKIHGLLSRVFGMQGYFSHISTYKMLRQISAFKPDVIHLHNLHANYVNLNMLFEFIAKNKIKTVITLHDCFLYTGKCVHYTKVGCYKWQQSCGACPNLNNGNPVWFLDRTRKMLRDRERWYKGIDDLNVIGVSDWVTNEAKKSVLGDKAKFYRIYNWIDVKDEKNYVEDITCQEKRKIIISVASNWDDTKGLQDLLRLSEIIGSEYVIYIVGNCNDKKERDNIRYFGSITNKNKLYELYRAALVLFHPSLEETFGLIIAEALAVGTPAIVYNSTACPELIGEKCGYVEELGDVNNVYKDIEKIAVAGKDSYSNYCKTFVRKNFMKEDRIRKLFSVYERKN